MGYYSEVAYVLAFENDEKRDAFREVVRLRKDALSKALNECAVSTKEPWLQFHDSSTKWYREFPDVQAHRDLMQLCIECGGAYRFLRVGEEVDDVEDMCDEADDGKVETPWDAFYLTRKIEWN